MKKIISFLLVAVSLISNAQIKVKDLPVITTGFDRWNLIVDTLGPGGTKRMSIANFRTAFVTPTVPSISGTTGRHAKFTGTTTLGNALLSDVDTNSILLTGRFGIGTSTPSAKLMVKGIGSTGSTYPLKIQNSNSDSLLYIRGNGHTTIGARFSIDAAGRIGLGRVPESWPTTYDIISIGQAGSILASNTSGNEVAHGMNYVYDGADKRIRDGAVSIFTQANDGSHRFYSDPTDTAGSTFAPTEIMRVHNYGLSLGSTIASPNYRLLAVGTGTTSATYTAGFHNATSTNNALLIRDDGKININNDDPDASSILDLQSTSRGLAPPRLTTLQRLAISSPVKSLIVYDSDKDSLFIYNGAWKAVGGGGSGGTVTSIATGNGITGGTITTTGTLGLSGATGDVGSFSGTNTYSAISAVATGYLLGSQGVSTKPAWLQAATLNTSLTTPIHYGSTSSGGTNTIQSTSHATKGKILFGTSAYDEVNNSLGIGTTSPFGFNGSQIVLSGASHVYQQMNTGAGNFEATNLFSRGTVLKYSFGMGAAPTANFYIYDYAASGYLYYGVGGNSGFGGVTAPTARVHLPAGSATADKAPLKFTSGTLNTAAEAGAVEFLTDNLYYTTTTSTIRKTIDGLAYRAITSARTLDGSDNLVNCTSGTFAVTLPTAVGFTSEYIITNSGTGLITLNTTSSQTISGVASGVIVLAQNQSITLRSNGANWIRNTPALNSPEATLTDAATVTWDVAASPNAVVTIAGNRTLAISNAVNGGYYTLRVIQSGSTRTLTSPAGCLGGNGMGISGGGNFPLSTTTGFIDIITVYYNGTNYFCNLATNYN